MLGSSRFTVTAGEVGEVLKVAFWFGLVAFATKAVELSGSFDFGTYKELVDIASAGLLWLVKKWASDTRTPLPHKYAGSQ